jgi:hypothetical protein
MQKKAIALKPGPFDLITPNEASQLTGWGLTALAEASASGRFVKPVDLAAPNARRRVPRYVRGEVEGWIMEQIAERDRKLAAQREQARELERKDRKLLGTTESATA